METLVHAAPFTGYVYPNETIIPWTVLIAVYPYLTGLVAGEFTVSSMYQVFGIQRFRPVAHLALLVSLCCMLIVPMPLLLHLGHPERALNSMVTPHWTSAFAVFGYAAGFYILLLILETWFVYRPYIVQQAQQGTGPLRWFYQALTLGSSDLSEKAIAIGTTIGLYNHFGGLRWYDSADRIFAAGLFTAGNLYTIIATYVPSSDSKAWVNGRRFGNVTVGAASTGADPVWSFGRSGYGEQMNGGLYGTFLWPYALPDELALEWSRNPWQVFRPARRRLYIPSVAAGVAVTFEQEGFRWRYDDGDEERRDVLGRAGRTVGGVDRDHEATSRARRRDGQPGEPGGRTV